MNCLILPINDDEVASANAGPWAKTDQVSLNGYFYDYLRASDNAIVGIRYWHNEDVRPAQHPVFAQFVNDPRFRFDPQNAFVDLVFQEAHIAALKNDSLRVDVVQDFGGDAVVTRGGQFGLSFTLESD